MQQTIFNCILDELFQVPLDQALHKYGIKYSLFFRYLAEHPEAKAVFDVYTQAVARKLALETVDIADTDLDPVRARVRIQARQWLAAKYLPKEYGERLDVNVQTVDLTNALTEARARRERLLHPSFTEANALPNIPAKSMPYVADATDLESVDALGSLLD